MKKHQIIYLILTLFLTGCFNHESTEESLAPYDENANALAEIQQASVRLTSGQRLLLVFGANWCPTCRRLDASLDQPEITKYLHEHFIIVKIDIGKFDKNLNIAAQYGLPIRQGVPAIVVVNKNSSVSTYIKTAELSTLHKRGREVLYEKIRNL